MALCEHILIYNACSQIFHAAIILRLLTAASEGLWQNTNVGQCTGCSQEPVSSLQLPPVGVPQPFYVRL